MRKFGSNMDVIGGRASERRDRDVELTAVTTRLGLMGLIGLIGLMGLPVRPHFIFQIN